MTEGVAYSRMDRLLYRVALSDPGIQTAVADLEDRLFRERFAGLPDPDPVFVTSLPRAGTTILLETLIATGAFASHTYRDLPFVLCPVLWDRVSRLFRKPARLRERAHADGILVGYDSPEAFEEILWTTFWREKYRSDRIMPWDTQDRNAEFEHFLRSHMRKIIALRAGSHGNDQGIRYLSKNNANIARLPTLSLIFPGSTVLVPFRNPWDHASSLRRQHLRFLKLHQEDDFNRRFMEWLGHFEFGSALRPIDFGGWLEDIDPPAHQDLEFWLTYWHAAYSFLLNGTGSNVLFVNYDRLCREPERILERVADRLRLRRSADLTDQAGRYHAAREHRTASSETPAGLAATVEATWDSLLSRAEANA